MGEPTPSSMPRGVLLAGGTGSRLDPLTRITNKHLLPIGDRPMVSWAVEALALAGVEELLVVTGGDHVDDFVRLLGDGSELGLRSISYAVQAKAGGIAEALGLAEGFAKGGPVVVMLADNLCERSLRPTVQAFAADPVGARLVLSKVEELEHLRHLGVPELGADGGVTRIVEKPEQPPSAYAVTGVYCYEAGVFNVVKGLVPSARGELEITDVNNHYVERGELSYDILEGFWGDAGESIEAYYAVNDFVRASGVNHA